MNEQKVPQIRFAGFTDDWEQRELGTITSSYSGGTPTAGKAEYYDGDIPFIRSGEINEEKTELFLSELGYNNSSAAMVEKGDILYALYGATSGEVSISKLKGAINQAILAIKPNEGYDSEFLMQWLRNQKENIISTYLQGGQGNLSGTIVKSFKVDVTTYAEQQQIGSYFRNHDNLITLHQRKCDTLRKLKQSMLQKMFPKEGEKVPEIRFAGFTDDWEQRKLGECFDERTERSADGELIAVTINSGVVKASELNRHDNSSEDKSNYKVVRVNDIAYNSMRMWQGASGYSQYDGILSPAYTVVIPRENVNPVFFSYMFKRTDMIHEFQINSQGLTSDTWNLKFPAFSTISANVPKSEEQQAIGNYFTNLDHLITLHQRKLETAKKLKKAMLQKMFI